jgi:transcriptional regulator
VPTWNYAVVHVEGRASVLDEGALLALVDRLAQTFEPSEEPWRMDALDPALLADLALAIVGFAIPVERMSGKLKLSQNRSPEDRARVLRAFVARGGADDLAMARLMKP